MADPKPLPSIEVTGESQHNDPNGYVQFVIRLKLGDGKLRQKVAQLVQEINKDLADGGLDLFEKISIGNKIYDFLV